jgi:hypothetical protein
MYGSSRCDEIVRIIDEALADNEASGLGRLPADPTDGSARRWRSRREPLSN